MAEDAKLKLELRLVPTEGEPNAALFDDLIRLIQQGILTAPQGITQIETSGEFLPPTDKSLGKLETGIKSRIDQNCTASQSLVEKRKEIAGQLDGEAKLATESLEAAQVVVSAVRRAIIRGIAVQVSDDKMTKAN
jgi:hypothetical protein